MMKSVGEFYTVKHPGKVTHVNIAYSIYVTGLTHVAVYAPPSENTNFWVQDPK
jgi:hypothetical protein